MKDGEDMRLMDENEALGQPNPRLTTPLYLHSVCIAKLICPFIIIY